VTCYIGFANLRNEIFARSVLMPVARLRDGARCCYMSEGFGSAPVLEIVPKNAEEGKVVLYLHGGAHMLFSARVYREFAGRIAAQLRARTVVLDYRKAPAHPFPAGLNDTIAAYDAIRARYPGWKIVVGGDSAGGNLALALLNRLAQLDEPQPAACFSFSPWLLMEPSLAKRTPEASAPVSRGHRLWDKYARRAACYYLQGHAVDDPLVSPALTPAELITKWPPVLLHAAEGERLRLDVLEMCAVCDAAGAAISVEPFPSRLHVFQALPTRLSRQSMQSVAAFLNRHCSVAPSK